MIFVLLQILRGVAASMVVFHHYVASQIERQFEVRQWIEDLGGSGVDIFFAISVAAAFILQPASLILQMAVNPIVFEFLLGCLAAVLYRKGYRLGGLQAVALAAAAVFLLSNIFHQTAFERILLWGVPAFMLIAAASLCQGGRLDMAILRPLVRLGDISYSLYLSHFFCLALFVRIQDRSGLLNQGFSPLSLALFTLLVLLDAELCYRWIEEPARKYFSRRHHLTAQAVKT